MTDKYFIGQLSRTDKTELRSNLRWTLISGQFSAEQQLYHSVDNDGGLDRKYAHAQEDDFLFFANAVKHISILLWNHLYFQRSKQN